MQDARAGVIVFEGTLEPLKDYKETELVKNATYSSS